MTAGRECQEWWQCDRSDGWSEDVGARNWHIGKVGGPVEGCCPIA